jgi:hypothetical protein
MRYIVDVRDLYHDYADHYVITYEESERIAEKIIRRFDKNFKIKAIKFEWGKYIVNDKYVLKFYQNNCYGGYPIIK